MVWWMNFLHKKQRPGTHPINKCSCSVHEQSAQVAIETAVAIVAIFIFLMGATQLFLWVNRNIIARQRVYQETRMQLSNEENINFYQPTRFHIFPQEDPGGH